MAQLVILMKFVVETSCKQVESFIFNRWWKCTHMVWLYVSRPYTSSY